MDDARVKEAVEIIRTGVCSPQELSKAIEVISDLVTRYLSVKGVEKKYCEQHPDNSGLGNPAYCETCRLFDRDNKIIDATRLWIAKRLPTKEDINKILNEWGYESERPHGEIATAISELIRERLGE